jgi:hypothetical protein
MHEEGRAGVMGILIDLIDPLRVERGRPPLDAVDDVALLKQETGKVSAILSGDPGNKRRLFLCHPTPRLSDGPYGGSSPRLQHLSTGRNRLAEAHSHPPMSMFGCLITFPADSLSDEGSNAERKCRAWA